MELVSSQPFDDFPARYNSCRPGVSRTNMGANANKGNRAFDYWFPVHSNFYRL